MNLSQRREKALKKLHQELAKDIGVAVKMAERCGLVELLYFVYRLRWLRLMHLSPRASKSKPHVLNMYRNSFSDSIRYIAPLIAKFGDWSYSVDKASGSLVFELKLVQDFLKIGNYINSKFETDSFIRLLDVDVGGERNQHIKIDFSTVDRNEETRKYFHYFRRIDINNEIEKNKLHSSDDLLQMFREEYLGVEDLFYEELGITVKEFCLFIENILKAVTEKIESSVPKFKKLDNGNLDVQDFQTFIHYSKAFVHDKNKLLKRVGEKYQSILERLIFKNSSFDEKELRYFKIHREPILSNGQLLVISPEFILDSLLINTHYLLTESTTAKDEYKARRANSFIDKLVKIAEKHGLKEAEREVELFEGKRMLGDIDLILRGQNGECLLIEAKNHVLPLDVYFQNVDRTRDHLEYQKEKWEAKVLKRLEHLKVNSNEYGIPEDYQYVIVTLFPEIISHFSELLILSLQEFEVWLQDYTAIDTFDQFQSSYYSTLDKNLSEQDLKGMQEAKMFLGRFEKE